MKMVVVFDTEDPRGQEASMKIMRHLLTEYDDSFHGKDDPRFGKIEFIRMLKDFHGFSIEQVPAEYDADDVRRRMSLKYLKRFADHVFSSKRYGEKYRTGSVPSDLVVR